MRYKKADSFKHQPHQNGVGMKAIIFTACLIGCGWARLATAEQHEGNPAVFQQLAMTSIVAYCDTMAAPSTHTGSVQMLPEKLEDSTEQVDLKNLHANTCERQRHRVA